ncbi:hypothetical protein BT63DRAFT_427440 [Microthyrium microscopicum]|uniref:Ureidoglycolate hydrolase n=1 Tax=Microthyrium microscopicum TaxID=703497 RepID=A0A6A6U400_9PEZI|nr:hypothetical protein BT63DRAFT_427440 [Microthyrium microscopicum]
MSDPLSPRRIPIEPLTPSTFAPFGTVIQNPTTATSTSHSTLNPILANQGTATKYANISSLENFYHLAPSRKPASAQMTMFICQPRPLRTPSSSDDIAGIFDVKMLERHAYTTQTFIPIGLAARDPSTCYLVIVAPTMHTTPPRINILARPLPYPVPDAPSKTRKKKSALERYGLARPTPYTNDTTPPPPPTTSESPPPWTSSLQSSANSQARASRLPRRAGPPNLAGLRAFIARGDQAVTYGAGTWHAPMVVLGAEAVEFVVVQFANGVGIEDCQELSWDTVTKSGRRLPSVEVVVDEAVVKGEGGMAGISAKL